MKYKAFTSYEKEHHGRLYDELGDIQDRVARHALAGEIVRDMHELDIGV